MVREEAIFNAKQLVKKTGLTWLVVELQPGYFETVAEAWLDYNKDRTELVRCRVNSQVIDDIIKPEIWQTSKEV